MEIILLEKIRNLGDLGEIVKVADGYARNFLIPQKKAMRTTAEAKAEVEERRHQLAEEESKRQEAAQARADLAVREIAVTRLVSEAGNLYGSVSPADIATALTEAGSRIEKTEVFLSDGPFKQTGIFEAEVILHAEVRFGVKITVLGEGQSGAPPPEADAPEAPPPEAAAAEAPPPEASAEAPPAATDTPETPPSEARGA